MFTASLLMAGTLTGAAPPPSDLVGARLEATFRKHWADLKLSPSPRADDATFLRRVYLGLAGKVPTPGQARTFLEDRRPDRRARVVDQLLGGKEFANHWARVWTEQLTGKRPIRLESHNGPVLVAYLSGAIEANKPYRAIVQELITGTGASNVSGPANFLLRYEAKPADLTGAIGQHFLGVSLQCAQCHDYKGPKSIEWTRKSFWGMAAHFSRLRAYESYLSANGDEDDDVYLQRVQEDELQGEIYDRGRRVMPHLPGARAGAPIPADRRRALADWVTADANPYFARQLVNRTWSQMFGSGLIPLRDGVDAAEDSTKDGRWDALDLLAADVKVSGFDFKRLVRVIVLSEPYQLAASAEKGKSDRSAHDHVQNFARHDVRALSVDQLYRSIALATGYVSEEERKEDAEAEKRGQYEEKADRPVTILGEKALTLQRTLALLHGKHIEDASKAGAAAALAAHGTRPGSAHIEQLFLSTLSRLPRPAEAATMLELAQSGTGATGLTDVFWTLLNSVEFLTTH